MVAGAGDGATPSKNPVICGMIGVLFTASAVFLGIVFLPFLKGSRESPSASDAGYTCVNTGNNFTLANSASKGICIDDTTMKSCFKKALTLWPNTDSEKIKYFRIFSAWNDQWEESFRQRTWDTLKLILEHNDAQLLLGVAVSCDTKSDDQSWQWAKELMKQLGPERIMAVAVGNEMELLWQKDGVGKECIDLVWKAEDHGSAAPSGMQGLQPPEGYFSWVFKNRMDDIKTLGPAYENIIFTTVMGGAALDTSSSSGCTGTCLLVNNAPDCSSTSCKKGALFDDWMRNILVYLGSPPGNKYVWVVNDYPFWEPSAAMDPGSTTTCEAAKRSALDLTSGSMLNPAQSFRTKMGGFGFAPSDHLWIGETGWSTPAPTSFKPTRPDIKDCIDKPNGWDSLTMFMNYYEAFLKWDISQSPANLDKVFYFSMRDSQNFGDPEGFGLVQACDSPKCKIQSTAPASFVKDAKSSDTSPRLTV